MVPTAAGAVPVLVRVARRSHGRLCCLASGLWGAAARSHRPTAADSFARYLKAPEVYVVAEAGHVPQLTAPATVVTALTGVLGGASRR